MLRRNRLTPDAYTRGTHCPSGWLWIFRVTTWMLRRSASCTKDFLSAEERVSQLLLKTDNIWQIQSYKLRRSGLNTCSQQQTTHLPKVVSTTKQAERGAQAAPTAPFLRDWLKLQDNNQHKPFTIRIGMIQHEEADPALLISWLQRTTQEESNNKGGFCPTAHLQNPSAHHPRCVAAALCGSC